MLNSRIFEYPLAGKLNTNDIIACPLTFHQAGKLNTDDIIAWVRGLYSDTDFIATQLSAKLTHCRYMVRYPDFIATRTLLRQSFIHCLRSPEGLKEVGAGDTTRFPGLMEQVRRENIRSS